MQIHESIVDQSRLMARGFPGIAVGIGDLAQVVHDSSNQVVNSVERASHDITKGIAGLCASFDMGMANIVTQFELQRKEINQGFLQLSSILENSRKVEAKERYLDGKTEYEKYLKFPDEMQFLHDALEYLQKSVEIYKGNPFSHFYLGHIYHEPTELHNLEKAFEHYKLCATYAKGIENKGLTGLGYFYAGWIAYVQKDTKTAIELSETALQFDDLNPENYYNLAKFYAVERNVEKSLGYLDVAIRQFDPNYSLKASLDPDFKQIEPYLTKFFDALRDEEAKNLETRLRNFGV